MDEPGKTGHSLRVLLGIPGAIVHPPRGAENRVERAFICALALAFPPDCGQGRPDVRAVSAAQPSAAPFAALPSHDGADVAPVSSKAVLSPLHAESWLIELSVQGYRDARVSVPLGASEARPVVVALHGAGDRPEWACGGWRGVTDAYPFVLCPSGDPGGLPNGFVWGNDAKVEREVNASIEALRRRFGEHVAPGCALLAGFSQGAIRMAPMLARGGGWCPQAALCEGAYDAVGKTFAHAFFQSGGRRLLLGCSQPYCAKVFGERESTLAAAGLDVRTVYSGGRTHNLNGEMVSTLRDAWPWLVRDDGRWSSYLQAAHRDGTSNSTN
jgi:predicted esterase